MAIDRLKMNMMEGREKILKPLMPIRSFRQGEGSCQVFYGLFPSMVNWPTRVERQLRDFGGFSYKCSG